VYFNVFIDKKGEKQLLLVNLKRLLILRMV